MREEDVQKCLPLFHYTGNFMAGKTYPLISFCKHSDYMRYELCFHATKLQNSIVVPKKCSTFVLKTTNLPRLNLRNFANFVGKLKNDSMKRCIIDELFEWKNSYSLRMPLVLQGARQIGKTYAIKKFGAEHYENVIYANFDSDVSLRGYFEGGLKPDRIITVLEDYFSATIHSQKTLILFDEIQECPRALTSLKYFAEEAPQYDIIAAGSLLGVALKKHEAEDRGTSFPVGKVYIKTMYPFNFEEFLWAKQKTLLANEIRKHFASNKKIPVGLHNEALELYQEFLLVGGMPLAVQTYVDNSSTPHFSDIQKLLSASYTADMTKYTEKSQGIRNIALYNSIPVQLGNSERSSNKFIYSAVEKGARTETFKDSVDWLETAGIALKCTKTSRGDVPPVQFADLSSFKLYLADVGLLSQRLKVTRENLQRFNQMYRGAITENYIAMELTQRGHSLYFWETNSNSEVDFVTTIDGAVIPIEVKSSENNRSKSLNAFVQKYKPLYAIRISEKNFGFENDIKSVPLYAAFCL
jgi:predicted AAA+ superfamily ATPase